jgi:hypothetical protein
MVLQLNQYLIDWILLFTSTCFGPHGTIFRQCIYNTTKLIEFSIWIHIVVQRVHVIKVIENCALCYDENYNIKLNYQEV